MNGLDVFRYSQLFHIFKLLHQMCDFEAFNVRHTDSSNTLFSVFVIIYLDWDCDWVYPSFYAFTCSNCCIFNLLLRIINHNDGTNRNTNTHTHSFVMRLSLSIYILVFVCMFFSLLFLWNSLPHWFTSKQFICACLLKIGNISIDWLTAWLYWFHWMLSLLYFST